MAAVAAATSITSLAWAGLLNLLAWAANSLVFMASLKADSFLTDSYLALDALASACFYSFNFSICFLNLLALFLLIVVSNCSFFSGIFSSIFSTTGLASMAGFYSFNFSICFLNLLALCLLIGVSDCIFFSEIFIFSSIFLTTGLAFLAGFYWGFAF